MIESDLQKAAAMYLDYLGLAWFHPANERKAKPQYMAKLKSHGVKPGIPDVMICQRPPAKQDFVGVAIELKTEDGTLSDNQEDWLKRLADNDWYADVCYGWDDFESTMKGLGW